MLLSSFIVLAKYGHAGAINPFSVVDELKRDDFDICPGLTFDLQKKTKKYLLRAFDC